MSQQHNYPSIINTAGGYDGDYRNDILDFDPKEDSMVTVGQMTLSRHFLAVSVVQAEDFLLWCK